MNICTEKEINNMENRINKYFHLIPVKYEFATYDVFHNKKN